MACIGIRGRGNSVMNSFIAEPDCEVTHLCDVRDAVLTQRGAEVKAKTVKMPKLVVHLPLAHASSFVNWARDSHALEGTKADGASGYEATGSVEVLAPHDNKILYTISLEGVGPEQIASVKSAGGSATAKTLKVDMYVTKLKLGS